jgi:MurNAc alpha-1-phosphate uridylyltransferase
MRAGADDPPKPLVEVAGKSLLERMLARLMAAGIHKIIVNVHHKAALIEAMLADFSAAHPTLDIIISDERDALLETGGGVKKALPLLGDAPFMVANADVLWLENNPALGALIDGFEPATMQARLLMADRATATGYDGQGDYHMDGDARLTRRGERQADWIFAGVQILDPALFAAMPDGAFSLNKIYDAAQERGTLFGCPLDGRWMHVGSPEGRAEAEQLLGQRARSFSTR